MEWLVKTWRASYVEGPSQGPAVKRGLCHGDGIPVLFLSREM